MSITLQTKYAIKFYQIQNIKSTSAMAQSLQF